MAKVEQTKNKIYIIGSTYVITIPIKSIVKRLYNRITGVITIETPNYRVVFSPESEPMIFPK